MHSGLGQGSGIITFDTCQKNQDRLVRRSITEKDSNMNERNLKAPASGEGMPPEPRGLGPYKLLSQELRAEAEHLHNPPTYWRDLFLKAAKHIEDMRAYALSLREQREWLVEVPKEKATTAIEILNRVGNRLYCDLPQDAKDGVRILAIAELLAAAPSAGREEDV